LCLKSTRLIEENCDGGFLEYSYLIQHKLTVALNILLFFQICTSMCLHQILKAGLSFQGYGRSLWMMQGMFRANGGCGFVKKPDFLLKSGPHGEVFDPKAKLPVQKTLKVSALLSFTLIGMDFSWISI